MLSRQRTMLRMLGTAGPTKAKLDLFKLMFILGEEYPSIPSSAKYEFLPYHRGPYSFTMNYDLGSMEREGLVKLGENDVTVTDLGLSEAEDTPVETWVAVQKVSDEYTEKSTNDLIDYVYSKYAWFTLNSLWEEKRRAVRPRADIAVYTTGYEGLSLDGLLNNLLLNGIERLIDVRSNPVARRYGFHKSTLSTVCAKVGIEYVHVPQVGVPSEWRSELDSVKAYSDLFRKYENEVLPNNIEAMIQIKELIKLGPSALMCKEANPLCCHRTTLAHALAMDTNLRVIDLRTEDIGALF